MGKRGGGEGGSVRIFCRKFLSQSAEKFRRGTLLCFTKFLVSKNLMGKRGGGEGGSIRISVENFCLRVPKNFVEEPFRVSKFLVSKNVSDKRGGGNHDFLSKLFCLTVPKHFVEEPFCAVFQKIAGCGKVYR